jgi:hypothetical protein
MAELDLQAKVEGWLREQGYPLEMRTALAFHRRGWFFHHSRRYRDPILDKEREIDLLAFNDDPATDERIHGHFVIECKWTPKKPWVLFTSLRQSLTDIGYFRSTPMTTAAASVVEGLVSKDVSRFPLFTGVEEGYAIVQAFRDAQAVDAAYSAVQAAVNAADFFARDMSESGKHSIVYVPTVVLDGQLFRCALQENGDVSVKPIEMGFLVYHTASDNRCVHIVRESALEKFIDRAEETFKSLRKSLKEKRAEAKQ